MIAFVVGSAHQYTIREPLQSRAHPLHGRVVILSFGEFASLPRLPAAGYAFLDHERLGPEMARAVERRFAALRAALPSLGALNPPDAYPGRLGVMRRLHEAGINRFRVLPVTGPLDGLRYPVFLRRGDDHKGPRTGLLPDRPSLDRALAALAGAGVPREAMVATEYVDARNADGLHEKRGCFRVGSEVFPVALDASRNWVCKGEAGDPDAVNVDEAEMAFLRADPDGAALRRAFDAAGIGYGRADYALVDGAPQVFEINTNPLIELPERMPPDRRGPVTAVMERWLGALAAFAGPPERGGPRWVAVDGAAPAPAEGSWRRRALRGALRAAGGLHRETEVLWRLRAPRGGREGTAP